MSKEYNRGVDDAMEAVRAAGSENWEGSQFKPDFITAIARYCGSGCGLSGCDFDRYPHRHDPDTLTAVALTADGEQAEIERLKADRLQIQRALASTVLEDPSEDDDPPYSTTEIVHGITSLEDRRRNAVKRAATARADAIGEAIEIAKSKAREYHETALRWGAHANKETLPEAKRIDTDSRDECLAKYAALTVFAMDLESLAQQKEGEDTTNDN